MAELAAAPPVVTPPAAGGTPNISTPTGGGDPNSGGGSPNSGAGDGDGSPKVAEKYTIDLGDGAKPFEIDFDGDSVETEGGESAGEFKFEQLDAIKESHGDLHKTLKKLLSERSRFTQKFDSPEALEAHLARVERIAGGRDLDALEQSVGNMNAEVQAWRTGEVAEFAKTAPEEFSASASKIADQWANADPKAWVGYLAKAAVQSLVAKDSYGQSALDAFNIAYGLAEKSGDANLTKALERVAHTFSGIVENSKFQPDTGKLRERQLQQREQQIFAKESDQRTGPLVSRALKESLKVAARKIDPNLKMTADEEKSYLADMEKNFYTQARQNPRFARLFKEAQQAKDLDAMDAVVKEYRTEFAANAAKAVYRTRLSKLKENIKKEAASKGEAGSGGTTAPGISKWSGAVDQNTGAPKADFDYARMKAENPDMLFDHQFYVKGKKEKYVW